MQNFVFLVGLLCGCTLLASVPGAQTGTTTIVNGGVYKIQSDNDQTVLTASDNGVWTKSLGATKTDVWKNTDEQKWTLRTAPTVAADNGKLLRSFMSRKNANNNLGFNLASAGSTPTVRYWEFVAVSGTGTTGKWQIKSYPDGKCLQSMGRTYAVQEKTCDSSSRSQRWDLLICNSLRCSDRKR